MTDRRLLRDVQLNPDHAPYLSRVERHWLEVLDGLGDREIHAAIRCLADDLPLAPVLVTRVFEDITAGLEDELSIAAFLANTQPQRLSGQVIGACAAVMRDRAHRIHPRVPGILVDTCGTGGDGLKTVNVSTAAALVLVSRGAYVAKHGNRAITSACGSADVLEAMGVPVDVEPAEAQRLIEQANFGFLFAPRFHPAMRFVQPVRRQLASEGAVLGRPLRTVFNVLGPLTNPALAQRQLVGVYSTDLVESMATALSDLGVERALVVHGRGPAGEPMDELSPFGPTHVALTEAGGVVRTFEVEPSELGVRRIEPAAVMAGGSPSENAARIRDILAGADDPASELIALNAGAALWISGYVSDLRSGLAEARAELRSGRPLACLERLIAAARSAPN